MIKKIILILLFFFSYMLWAQNKTATQDDNKNASKKMGLREQAEKEKDKIKKQTTTIDKYKIISLERDTIFVDTSLTIKSEYKFNYLRKDHFGLFPFANEGQPYNTLDFGLIHFYPHPNMGFKAKRSNFLEYNDIKYYHVATPFSELYYKSVMEQGQTLDAFITLNTSENLNFSIAYKGLRSVGRYLNSLSSTGNFRFTTSYHSKEHRYLINGHFTAQDIMNQENGGIINREDFENGDEIFRNRARIPIHLTDASSLLKGNRYFIDQSFRINKKDNENNIYINHRFFYDHQFFQYLEPTVSDRFGDSYLTADINDKVRYNNMYNKMGVIYENKQLGDIEFFVADFRYNYFYNRIIFPNEAPGNRIPNRLNDQIQSLGIQYRYQKNNWNAKLYYTSSVSNHDLLDFKASIDYKWDNDNQIEARYERINSLPNHNFNLFQSSHIAYNWFNDFKNQKINTFKMAAKTQWVNASMTASTMRDYLYFADQSTKQDVLLVKPQQYDQTINYIAFNLGKEFRYGKWALDNTVLFQKVDQKNPILNVPEFVVRNTLYYSSYFFNKALFIQTGVTLNYFSGYYADNYNPVLGEFFTQNKMKIGNFPLLDYYINAKVRTFRLYLKAEHFNSSFGENSTFYSAPDYPYRDFMIRFGVIWNFFS